MKHGLPAMKSGIGLLFGRLRERDERESAASKAGRRLSENASQ
jgi:hypothetical protein